MGVESHENIFSKEITESFKKETNFVHSTAGDVDSIRMDNNSSTNMVKSVRMKNIVDKIYLRDSNLHSPINT
jgi:hypothetical protein